jgi:hypothetical protein
LLHTHKVIVTGFVIVGAGFDGILVANSDNVQVSHNLLVHNGDVGVDFNGTSYSLAYHNVSEFNGGGGFLVADDLGVNHDNVVAWNFATRNPGRLRRHRGGALHGGGVRQRRRAQPAYV